MRGHLILVLHAHLPYVRHPEHERFLEEDWLFEALTESYIPLLAMMERLADDGVPFRLTLSLSPTLISMLEDELLQERYLRHLDRLSGLAEREMERTSGLPRLAPLADFYSRMIAKRREQFEGRYGRRLLPAFRALRDAGFVELLCGTATHAYLPLLRLEPAAVRAQVRAGAAYCAAKQGRAARGIWLAECGYYPGLDAVLREEGLDYFFLETHGLEHASPRPADVPYVPVRCPSGLVAFGRDQPVSRLIWSAQEGYPGDPDYREFYRDIGFELPPSHLGDCLHEGRPGNTGFKYHRVTGATEAKEPYEPATAARKARQHAADFVFKLRGRMSYLEGRMVRAPLVVAPFDAELFGHWWFEGPLFLEAVLRALAAGGEVVMTTPSAYLEGARGLPEAQPAASSWGAEGYNAVWLGPENDWVWPRLHQAAEVMRSLAAMRDAGTLIRRALDQALRSLMLAQASDWPFLMHTNTAANYARGRVEQHLGSFFYLAQAIGRGDVDPERLAAIEELDGVLPGCVDHRMFGTGAGGGEGIS
jgi:1,4-alpha-glucan branching enzyme